MSDPRIHESFGKALAKLKEFVAAPIVTERDRAGVIQAFEFTFEQCWKAFQRALAAQGYESRSPRKSLEGAMQPRLICQDNEKTWLKMTQDCKLTSHLYHEKRAVEIADRIVANYLPLLTAAHQALEK